MGPTVKFADNLILKVEDDSKARQVLDLYLRNREAFECFEPTRPEDFYTVNYHAVSLYREYKAYQLGTFLRYYIYLFPDEYKIIGSVNFNFINSEGTKFVEIGYKVDVDYQNMGIAYTACTAAMKVIRNDYGITRVDARIHPANLASRRLAEKLGFKPVYTESQWAHVNGRYVHLIRYSLDISDIQ